MNPPSITVCPHCQVRILPSGPGCPACGKLLSDPVEPPARPARRPTIHPVLYGICVLVMVGGFIGYLLAPKHDMETIGRVLMVIWAGTLGIFGLTLKREVLERRPRRRSRPIPPAGR